MNEHGESVWAEPVFPPSSRRSVHVSYGLEDLFNERRPISLSDVAAALWAEPRASAQHDDFCDSRPIYPLGPCSCEELRKVRALNRPHIAAERIQALWRGHKTRQDLAKKNAEEIAVVEARWRRYDERYRIYVVCQNLMVEMMKDDTLWDATSTPYYIWMLEMGGPWIDEAEDFMRLRGWIRPQNEVRTHILKNFLVDALMQCGFTETQGRAFVSIVNTFKVPGESE